MSNAVSWIGLTSVKEAPSGGEPKPFYLDGLKYLNLSSSEEFEATIEAFSSPREFDLCDGTVSMANGLFITQQPRRAFGFSYRSRIGNDLEGSDHGYKIHLVYNALAAPSGQDNNTISDSPDPITFSWAVTTIPEVIAGVKPTAHFVIDSRQTPEDLLENLEDILYGTAELAPRLLPADELFTMFTEYVPFMITTFEDGSYSAEGSDVTLTEPEGSFEMEHDSITDNGDGSFSIL
jgi:hypothetical protein